MNIPVGIAIALLVSLLVYAFSLSNVVKEDIELASRKIGADIVLVPTWAKDLAKGQVYVGGDVAKYLGLLNTITLFDKKLVVSGELEETGIGLDHGLFVRIEDLDTTAPGVAGQYKPGDISIAFLRLKDGANPDEVARKIGAINPKIGIMTRANIGGEVPNTLKY